MRYNYVENDAGEIMSQTPGWTVIYPATCNGHLGDIGFVASTGMGGSGFVHFDLTTGEPYGMPLTKAARERLIALRRDVMFSGRITPGDRGLSITGKVQ